jgi:hypothetical protein
MESRNLEDRIKEYLDASTTQRRELLDKDQELWFFLNSIEYTVKVHLTELDFNIPILDRLIKEIENKIGRK